MRSQAERQIFGYIRGKVGISLLVALVHAGVLRLVGLDLWLVFGVLAFLLNFIPNVGMLPCLTSQGEGVARSRSA